MEEVKATQPKKSKFLILVERVNLIVEKHNQTRLPKFTKAKIMEFFGYEAKNIEVELVEKNVELINNGRGGKLVTGHLTLKQGEESYTIPMDGSNMEFGIDYTSPNPAKRQEAVEGEEGAVNSNVRLNKSEQKAKDGKVKSQAEQDFKFARAIKDGRAFMKTKDFVRSLDAYKKAHEIRPTEKEPIDMIAKLAPPTEEKKSEVATETTVTQKEATKSEETTTTVPEQETKTEGTAVDAKKDEAAKTTPDPEMIDHEVTEQDLIDNPELKGKGVKVGDTIQIPKPEVANEADAK